MKAKILLAAAALLAAATATAEIENRVLLLGDYDETTTQVEGQAIEQAPFNFFHTYSGSEVIYSAAEIQPLTAEGAKIKSITFKYGDPTYSSYNPFTVDLNCFLQLNEEGAFTLQDGAYYWFKPDANKSVTATRSYEISYDELLSGEPFEITMTFDTPFEIKKEDAGKALMVVSYAAYTDGDSDYGQYVKAYVYNNDARDFRMGCWARERDSDENTFLGLIAEPAKLSMSEGSDVYKTDLPVAKIEYTVEINTGVENIAVGSEGEATVYTLGGVAVGNSTEGLTPGLYLVRQGGKVVKTAVR